MSSTSIGFRGTTAEAEPRQISSFVLRSQMSTIRVPWLKARTWVLAGWAGLLRDRLDELHGKGKE